MRTRQIVSDVLVLLWCLAWISLGLWVHSLVMSLAGPARSLSEASRGLGSDIDSLGGRLPKELRGPFQALSGQTDNLSDTGEWQVEAISTLATVMGVGIVIVPVGLVLLIAVWRRLRWWQTARAVVRLRDGGQNPENFEAMMAQRALVQAPMHRLAQVSADPEADLKAGNFRRLAAIELERLGVRPARRDRL